MHRGRGVGGRPEGEKSGCVVPFTCATVSMRGVREQTRTRPVCIVPCTLE